MGNIVIINYGMGNINSIVKKLRHIGKTPVVSSNPKEILSASKMIFPGVGHFASAVSNIKTLGLWETLDEAVLVKKIPILGICLGMQLMARSSEEGNENGFGWFDSEVVRFRISDSLKYKVPHTGWNDVSQKKENPLFKNLDLRQGFYFVHSYHIQCDDTVDILGETNYSYKFVSAVQKENIYGVQFHPEKSHEEGEKLFINFCNL